MGEGSVYDAQMLAASWLAVAVASQKHDSPILDRTVLVEKFPEGLRLVATDSYIILWSWVPAIGHEFDPVPQIDEAPAAKAIARDIHKRCAKFMRHVGKLGQRDDDQDPVEIAVRLGVSVEPSAQAPLGGLDATYALFDFPGHERIQLETVEGSFPSWQHVIARFEGDLLAGFALSPYMAEQLGKIGKLFPGRNLVFRHGGANRMMRFEMPGDPAVEGGVMPVRWDIARDEPVVEEDAEQTEAAQENLLRQAMELVVTAQLASPSMLNRKLKVSFSDGEALLRSLRERGVVGAPDGSGNCAVIMTVDELELMKSLSDVDTAGPTDGEGEGEAGTAVDDAE